MEQAYAEALFKMVESGKTPKAAVSAVQKMLEKRGRIALLPRIKRAFARLAEQERMRSTLFLHVAKEKDVARAKKEMKKALASMHIDDKDVEVKEDEHLIGGWRLEGRENLYDASYKKHLLELYKRVTS